MVSGEATPAVMARKPNPKKKLIAGPMLAMVAAEMSRMPSAPRRSRCCSCPASPARGLLLSPNGRDSVPLMMILPAGRDQVART